MPRDLHPPFEMNYVNVAVTLPGASSSEVETYLAYPIEDALKGLKGVEKITSTSSNGVLSVNLKYEAGFDEMDQAAEIVRASILAKQSELPESVKDISVDRQRTNKVWLSAYLLSNFDAENLQHRIAIKKLKDRIEAIPGIVMAESTEPARDIYIDFIPSRLKEFELSVTEVRGIISKSLQFAPVGRIKSNESSFSVELERNANQLEDIQNIPLRSNLSGQQIFLKDVADVKFELGEKTTRWYYDQLPSTVLRVFKDTTSDSIDLSEKLKATIESFKTELPQPIELKILADGPYFIKNQLNVLLNNGIIGSVIVLVILLLFLNARTSLWTFLGVPIAYLGTFILLQSMGMSIDLISMIGLLLVLGILVDDAIIVAEKYSENLEAGLAPKDAAQEAVRQLIKPVTGTVLTTIFAFSPLIIIDGDMATILFAVPVVIISCLILSWIESFFILPNHLSHFVKKPPGDRAESWMKVLRSQYKLMLNGVIRFRYLAAGVLTAIFILTGFIAAKEIQHDFKLSIGMESVTVFSFLKESHSLDETYAAIHGIEKGLYEILDSSEIDGVSTRVGSAWHDGREKSGYRYSRMRIYINKFDSHPSVLRDAVLKKVEDYLKDYPEKDRFETLSAKVTRQGADESKKSMITISASGRDEYSFEDLEKTINEEVTPVAGISRYANNPDQLQETWEFESEPQVLIQYGLTQSDVARQIRGHFVDDELKEIRMNGDSVTLYTRMKQTGDPEFRDLPNFKVITPVGVEVSLNELGGWKQRQSLSSISHQDGVRNFRFDFEYDTEEVNELQVKKNVEPIVKKLAESFPAYQIELVSSNEGEADNMIWGLKVAAICVGLVLLTMALVLGSLSQPLLVGLPIPFGIMGIIWALYLHDMPLGLMALIGLIGVVGVAVNDSLIMIDQINLLGNKKGKVDSETIVEGASSRLRAILLTTVTTLGGVFPMAYSLGGESGFTQPLAFAMGWGLSFATFLTLFVLPAIMVIQLDIKNVFLKIKNKWFPSNAVEEDLLPELNRQRSGSTDSVSDEWRHPRVPPSTESTTDQITHH